MSYLIHFEDGSYGYLAHHGIKGMKWGKWNDETLTRYKGGERSARTKKLINKRNEISGELNELNKHAKFVNSHGHRAYADKSDSKKAWDYYFKRARVEKKAYKSDAKDAGMKPNRKIARDIGKGYETLEYGLKDTRKKVNAKLSKKTGKPLSVSIKNGDAASGKTLMAKVLPIENAHNRFTNNSVNELNELNRYAEEANDRFVQQNHLDTENHLRMLGLL